MKFILIVALCLSFTYTQEIVEVNKVRHTSFPVLISIIAFSSGFVLAVLFLAISLVYNK
jgi:hypothetical protein